MVKMVKMVKMTRVERMMKRKKRKIRTQKLKRAPLRLTLRAREGEISTHPLARKRRKRPKKPGLQSGVVIRRSR
jgi:hypothetical protein